MSSETSDGLPVKLIDSGIAESPVYCISDPMNLIFPYNIGNSLWSASLDLVSYLKLRGIIGQQVTDELSVLELGAGCGSVGMTMWMNGYNTTLTDLHEMVPMMKENIKYNKKYHKFGDIQALALDWTNIDDAQAIFSRRGPFHFVVGAEISYDPHLHPFIIQTLLCLCGISNKSRITTSVLLAIPQRDNDEKLIEEAELQGFKTKIVHTVKPNHEHASQVAIYELIPPHPPSLAATGVKGKGDKRGNNYSNTEVGRKKSKS